MQPMKLMPSQVAEIGDSGLRFEIRNGKYQCRHCSMPNGHRDEDDIAGRNLKIATFAEEGVRHEDLAAAFGIGERHASRLRDRLRTRGWRHFREPPKRRAPSAVLEERKAVAERRPAEGASIRQAAIDAGHAFEMLISNLRKDLIETPAVSAEATEDAAPSVEETASPLDRFSR